MKATIQEDRLIKRKLNADPRKTSNDIARELREKNLVDVSIVPVSRRLFDVGFFGRIAAEKNLSLVKKTRQPDGSLRSCIKTGLIKIRKMYFFG